MKANSKTLSFSIHIFKQSFKPFVKRPKANLLDTSKVSVRLQRAVNHPLCFCLPLLTCQNWANSLSWNLGVPSAILSAQSSQSMERKWKYHDIKAKPSICIRFPPLALVLACTTAPAPPCRPLLLGASKPDFMIGSMLLRRQLCVLFRSRSQTWKTLS